MTRGQRLPLVAVPLLAFGCGLVPERVPQDDARLKPMFDAIARVDRRAMGFTPIARDAGIRLETAGGRMEAILGLQKKYDAMLHISGKTSRTIAFKRTSDGYDWIWEQETFKGPREYDTVDGTFPEEITLTYQRVPISGYPIEALHVQYHGPNSELAWPRKLTLEIVRPLLAKWGYD